MPNFPCDLLYLRQTQNWPCLYDLWILELSGDECPLSRIEDMY
jgi:hypothetical protein